MLRASTADPAAFPRRGVAGGWRDPWGDDDTAAVRAAILAAERACLARSAALGAAWRAELAAERGGRG